MSKINPTPAIPAATVGAATTIKDAISKTVATKPAAKPVTAKPAITKTAVAKTSKLATTTKAVAKKVVVAAEVKVKPIKVEKAPKLKMERDSFTMPKVEYAQFSVLKERLIKLGQPAKKSELLRAGIMQLTAMTDAALKAAMSKVPAIKTGRPNKK
jgi:hypothetical protein